MTQQNLYFRVSQAFQSLGWSAGRHAPTVAERYFDTAAGPKFAYIMLSPAGQLLADYVSEGRNVLEPLWNSLLQEDCSQQTLCEVVRRFEADVTQRIDQTYARGLWLRRAEDEPLAA